MKLCFQADTLGAAGECMALDSTGLGVTHHGSPGEGYHHLHQSPGQRVTHAVQFLQPSPAQASPAQPSPAQPATLETGDCVGRISSRSGSPGVAENLTVVITAHWVPPVDSPEYIVR